MLGMGATWTEGAGVDMTHPAIACAAIVFDLPPDAFVAPRSSQYVCEARNAIVYALHAQGVSDEEIGEVVCRSCKTISRAIAQAERLIQIDPRYTQRVRWIMEVR